VSGCIHHHLFILDFYTLFRYTHRICVWSCRVARLLPVSGWGHIRLLVQRRQILPRKLHHNQRSVRHLDQSAVTQYLTQLNFRLWNQRRHRTIQFRGDERDYLRSMLRTSRATMSTIYLAQWDDLMVVQKLQRDLNRRGVTEVDVLQHF
jgi:hypothetical protein